MKISVLLTNKDVTCWNFTTEHAHKLSELLDFAVDIDVCNKPDEFAESMINAEMAISWRFSQEWIDRAENLKVIATPAAGMDYYSVQLPENVISINGTFHGPIMAETAIGMMLDHCRGISKASAKMTDSADWPRTYLDSRNSLLNSSRILILGFGRIGQWIGQYAKFFGAAITGVRRTLPDSAPSYFTDSDLVITLDKLASHIKSCDHIVMVLPANQQSDNLINRELLDLLPPHAGIYNLGRGNAIVEEDLVRHLRRMPKCTAYLDVFQEEPLSEDSELRKLDNAILMPHASAICPQYLERFVEDLAPKLLKMKKNGKL